MHLCVCVYRGVRESERERYAGESDEVPVHYPQFTKHFHSPPATWIASFPAECCALACPLCVYAFRLSCSSGSLALPQFCL